MNTLLFSLVLTLGVYPMWQECDCPSAQDSALHLCDPPTYVYNIIFQKAQSHICTWSECFVITLGENCFTTPICSSQDGSCGDTALATTDVAAFRVECDLNILVSIPALSNKDLSHLARIDEHTGLWGLTVMFAPYFLLCGRALSSIRMPTKSAVGGV